MSSQIRWPTLFPPRIYELTYRMLEHAVQAELGNLVRCMASRSVNGVGKAVHTCEGPVEVILERRE